MNDNEKLEQICKDFILSEMEKDLRLYEMEMEDRCQEYFNELDYREQVEDEIESEIRAEIEWQRRNKK